MSNIYIQEPPTEGKVLLVTSAGDFDIELWSKETPKACRNFIQLCLEGYYDGCVFHRVIPGFIVQGGDPTGTGMGGESVYGKPFRDEFHSRLRFVRRGLVAMANAGSNDNGSQFFFTLGNCSELQNKHTIFGKIAGDTIYNISRFEEGEIGKDDRPEYPHKITSTKVLNNPFPDIEPRASTKIVNEIPKESHKAKKGKKDYKLLSFGDEAEEDEEENLEVSKVLSERVKSKSAHDLAEDSKLSSAVERDNQDREEELKRIREKLLSHKKVVEKSIDEQSSLIPSEITKDSQIGDKKRSEVKAEIKRLKRELHGNGKIEDIPPSIEEDSAKKTKIATVVDQYHKDIKKYKDAMKSLPKKGASRESQTLALLDRFSKKIKDLAEMKSSDNEDDVSEGAEEVDNDDSWITHRLQFTDGAPVLAKDASTKDDTWYDIDDPRSSLNKQRREKKAKK